MSFFIGFVIITLSATVVSVKTLTGYITLKRPLKIIIGTLISFGWFSPFLIGWLMRTPPVYVKTVSAVSFVGYTLFGMAFLLFCLLLSRDTFWFVSYGLAKLFRRHPAPKYNPRAPESYPLLNKTNAVCTLLAFILTGYALYDGIRIPSIKTLVLETPKISETIDIVQLSDLHLNRFSSNKHLTAIVDIVNRMTPDIIVLTGDLLDDSFDKIRDKTALMTQLKAKNGVYMVWGNHEYYTGVVSYKNDLEQAGLTVLTNDGGRVGGIYLAGITTPDITDDEWDKTLATVLPDDYVVLLSHYPSVFDIAVAHGIDLQLSGHTHGGQIFPFHFIAERVNGYLAGLYENGSSALYVSRGTGLWGPPLRLFAMPEITHIVLKGTKKTK